MDKASEKIVPKFASFRNKPTSCGQGDGQPVSDPKGRQRDGPPKTSSADDLKHGQYPSIQSSPRRHHERQAVRSSTPQALSGNTQSRPRHDEQTPPSFVIDRVGDPNNLDFGTLHQYTTPSYSRYGRGNVLGIPTGQKIDQAVSNEKGLVLSYNQQRASKRGDRRALWKVAQSGIAEMKVKPQASRSADIQSGSDFVSFRATHRVRARQRTESSSPDLSSKGDYSGMNVKPRVVQNDPDLVYESDASSSPEQKPGLNPALASSVQERRIELSRRVDAEPLDYLAWLEFIQQRSDVLSETSHALTSAERQSNSDIKLTMYEKALKNVRDPSGREIMLLGKMDEAAQVWDNGKLTSEWQSALQNNLGSLRLWNKYLEFRQTTFETFRFEDVRSVFVTCLSLLKHSQCAAGVPTGAKQTTFSTRIQILLRMTLLMVESGFVENAVAAWQALMEYEFFRPQNLQGNEHKEGGPLHQSTISNFEGYWDREVPRLGEDRCRGWASSCYGEAKPPQPKMGIASTLEAGHNIWAPWVESEVKHGLVARKPARTIDEAVEDDPYRVIMFSDVQLFLIDMPSLDCRGICVDAFLAFCHLPPCQLGDPAGMSRSWWRDGYLRNYTLYAPSSALQPWNVHFPEEQILGPRCDKYQSTTSSLISPKRTLFDFPASDYQLSPDILFAVSGTWFSAFDTWMREHSEDHGPVDKVWVLQSLKQLVAAGAGGDSLAEYALALELRLSPETVERSARHLLKKRSSSLLLYNAYALVKYRLGNADEGANVIVTSIHMSKTLGEHAQLDLVLLWRTWVWELLNAGKAKEALVRILMYGDEDFPSSLPAINLFDNQAMTPALLLRTEKALTATRDYMLLLPSHRHAVFAIECLFIFEYLKTSMSLPAATSVFRSNLSVLSTQASITSTTIESLHQSFAHLLYHHATHSHLVKPSEIRSLLAESVTQFPQNTIFLSLYAWNEARFRIDDRVRSIIKDVVLPSNQDADGKRQESVVSHFFAIYTELNRGTTLGSNTSTIRSTFERAVTSANGTHCAGLWKLYFLFEQSRADVARAKGVFWRCIKACPWAKLLYMLAFEFLRGTDGLTDEELRSIYELMGEKELRIHVSLEDVFEAMAN